MRPTARRLAAVCAVVLAGTLLTSSASAGPDVSLPPTAGAADYQLGGAYPPAPDVEIVTRDRGAQPAEGVYNVCYVNSFQTQPGTLSWWTKHHRSLLLRDSKKRVVRDAGWPDEVLLDLRTATKRAAVATINRAWFGACARAGFDAVEPDNLDSWTRSRGLLTRAHATDLAKRLVRDAHAAGLAIAQKNAAELTGRRIGFDFAVAEECEVYRECGTYTRTYGTRLVEIEYTDNGRAAFERACAARSGRASILLRDRDVVPRGRKGYVSRTC